MRMTTAYHGLLAAGAVLAVVHPGEAPSEGDQA